MSPTDAMLTRMADLSGPGGGGGGSIGSTNTGSGGGSVTVSGVLTQAASSSSSATRTKCDRALVTETDTEDINLRDAQATAQHVQFVEIVRGPDTDAGVIPVVDLDALDV